VKRNSVKLLFLSFVLSANTVMGGGAIAQAAEQQQAVATGTLGAESNRASSVVISEFYAGHSSNTSADLIYKNDFVELFNPTAEPVDVNGWSLQYADAKQANWKSVSLQGTILPYGFYLIELKDNSGPNAAQLPIADVRDTLVDLNNNKGKLALMSVTTAGSAALPAAEHVVNYVCYGKAADLNAEECPAGQPIAEAGQKNTMQRHVFDPLNPAASLEAASLPLSGNDWDTGNGAQDFAKKSAGNPHNASTVALPRAYALSSQTVLMDSLTAIDPAANVIGLDIVHGFVKANPVYGTDFEVEGLPEGLEATAAGDADSLTITITGQADENVTADTSLAVKLLDSIWDVKQPASVRPELSVLTGNHTLLLKAAVEDPAIAGQINAASSLRWNANRTQLDAGYNSLVIELASGTPKDGLLAADSYTLAGLPDGLVSTAIGDAQNKTITIQLTGAVALPILEKINLSVVLLPSAVQESERTASASLAATIQPYVDASAARKAEVASIIKDSNSYYMNAIMKEFKYSNETQGKNGFNFYRGTPELFYNDMGTARMPLPAAWSSLNSLTTWIEGDAHLQNVGVYNNGVFAGSDTNRMGEAIFGMNDFDSAYIAPFYWDLLRLIPSLYMERDEGKAGSEMALSTNDDVGALASQFLDRYYEAMDDIASGRLPLDTELNVAHVEEGFTKQLLVKSGAVARDVNVADETDEAAGGRAFKLTKKSGNKYWPLAADARAAFEQSWLAYTASVADQFPQEIKDNPNYFKIKDVVYRINQGNASIGSKRYNVLLEGPTTAWQDDILIDVKASFLPDMFQDEANSAIDLSDYTTQYGENHAQRAVDAYRLLSVTPEPFLGVMELEGQTLMVKAIPVSKNDYVDFLKDGSFGTRSDLSDYLKYTAQAFALAHTRATAADSEDNFAERLTDALNTAQWESFKQQLIYVSENYYLQVKADFNALKADLQAGNLLDIRHLKELTVSEGASADLSALNPAFTALHPYPVYDGQWPNLEYTVVVQPDTEYITLNATAEDAKALVAIGDQTAELGKSVRQVDVREAKQAQIKVTARDGSSFIYTVVLKTEADLNDEAVAADKQALAVGYVQGDQINRVTGNVSLPQAGAHGTTIAWKSSNPVLQISGAAGLVTRPAYYTGDVQVTLTATIKKGDAEATQTFVLTVLRQPDTGGGSNSGTPVAPSPQAIVSTDGTIKVPAGSTGTVSLPGKISIAVPANAATGEVQLTIEQVQDAAQTMPTAMKWISDVFEVRSNVKTDLNKPVTVTVGFKSSELKAGEIPAVYYYDEQKKAWVKLPGGKRVGDTIEVDTTHLAAFVVFAVSEQENEEVVAPAPQANLVDISGHWANAAIQRAAELGVVAGYADGSFKPEKAVTRAEFIVMLARLSKWAPASSGTAFTDQDSVGGWAANAIAAAVQQGVIAGYEDGSFRPNDAITRAEMIVMLARSEKINAAAGAAASFADYEAIPVWARGSVDAFRQLGFIQGRGNNSFAPQASATRAEATILLLKVLDAK
jgi:uncharacterized protein (DUF2252 family)